MKARVEKITYRKAKEMIEAQPRNRRVRKGSVKRLAKQMIDGLWVLNGESIIVDEDGLLLDGQHRLNALLHAVDVMGAAKDLFFESVVTRGAPRSAFDTIDQGDNRSVADAIEMDDHKYSQDLAVALRLLKIRMDGGKVSGYGKITPHEMLELLHKHKGLKTSMRKILDIGNVEDDDEERELVTIKSLFSPGYAAAIHYMGKKVFGAETVDSFFLNLCDENYTTKGMAPFTLRKLLRRNKSNTEHKIQRDALVAFVIKALCLYADDHAVNKLTIHKDEVPSIGGYDKVGIEEDVQEEDEA